MKNKELRGGIVVNFISKYSNVLIGLILTSVLARLITPEEFGVVSVVMVFVTFFNVLGDMGIGPAIIQNKKLSLNDIKSIFTFTVFVGILMSTVFFVFSYVLVWFYKNNVYLNIGKLLSISIFFSVINIVPNAILYKEKKFKITGFGSIIINIFVGIIVIISAFKGASYYSLVLQSILTSVLIFFYNLYFSKLKWSLHFNLNSIKKITHFSKYQFYFNFINYFSRNSDNILIGKFLGATSLGYYDKAYKLMLYPVQNLTFVITPILHPILSEYQNQKDIILEYYLKVIKILSLIGVFISIFCFISAKEIIIIMFGDMWLPSIIVFKILSITIVLQMVASSTGAIFQSTGYVNKLFLSGILSAIVNVLGIVIGVILGKIEFVAFFILIAFTINFFQTFYILIKMVFKIKYIDFLKKFINEVYIALIMIIFINIFKIHIDNIFFSFIFKLSICSISYLLGIIITKEYKEFKVLVKK